MNIKVAATIADHVSRLEVEFHEAYQAGALMCESPIEKIMLARLLTLSTGYTPTRINFFATHKDETPGRLGDFDIWIVPQYKSGPYRADFMVLLGRPQRAGPAETIGFAIECDGHAFHEKTKDQAARDKARDRYFTSRGCKVFRYTGSEIYRNEPDLLNDLQRAISTEYETSTGLIHSRVA